jgi:Fe-S-cluster containining protein
MPRPRRETDAALQHLYDQIPAMTDCRGHCWISCGPVEMSDRENQRIRGAGFRITNHLQARQLTETFWCEALGPDGRCQVYGIRPLVCRLWGAVESMPCPYGCRPQRWLSDAEGRALVAESLEIGGYGQPGETMALVEAMARIPGMAEKLREFVASKPADRIRVAHYGQTLPPEVTSRRALRR